MAERCCRVFAHYVIVKKSSFTKSETKTGKGIGDTITKTIGKMGELHLPANKGEHVQNGSFNNLQKYSYCGPGTKYDQRVKEGYDVINELKQKKSQFTSSVGLYNAISIRVGGDFITEDEFELQIYNS